MPPASRISDIASGHGGYPPSKVIQGSSDVFVGGLPQHRKGDAIMKHKKKSSHLRKSACGSSSVFVNSKQAVRIGDCVSCGGLLVTGCGSVVIGG